MLSALICVLLTLSMARPAMAASSYYAPLEHQDISINELQYTDLDLAGTAEIADRFYSELASGTGMDKDQIVSDYQELVQAFDLISDKMQALQAQYYVTPDNAALTSQIARYRAFLADQESYVRSLLAVTLEYEEYSFLTDLLTEEEKAMIRRSTEIPTAPDEDGAETANADASDTANTDSSDTESDAAASESNTAAASTATASVPANPDLIQQIRDGITALTGQYYMEAGQAKPDPRKLTDIYLQMAAGRNMLAQLQGFTDYEAYQSAWGNNIMTEAEADAVHAAIREKIAPIYKEVRDTIRRLQLSDLSGSAPTEIDEQWSALRPVITAVHPDLAEAYDYLTANRLYVRSNASLSAYTAPLYTTNSAFIFTSPKTYLEDDYMNLTHEFGHFNNDYHTEDHHLCAETHLSVKEFHSQGLELLSWHHSDELFAPEENEAYRLFLLGKKLVSILDGSIIDELERSIYKSPAMNADELKELYTKLYTDYFGEAPEDPYFFTTISHIYESPFYYMHYATSALNALEIWDEAFDDEGNAVDRYMRASALNVWTPYEDMVAACGLMDMQDADNVSRLAEKVEARLEKDAERRDGVLQPIYEERARLAREAEAERIRLEREAEMNRRKRIALMIAFLAALVITPAFIVSRVYRSRLRAAGEVIRNKDAQAAELREALAAEREKVMSMQCAAEQIPDTIPDEMPGNAGAVLQETVAEGQSETGVSEAAGTMLRDEEKNTDESGV